MLDFGETWLLERLLWLIPLVISLSIHEWAHAWCALQLGDDTAAREGRVTLNPLVHMDPIGTFLLPLLGVPFGWAKPVLIDPSRFRVPMNTGLMLTAAAGPISNVALALLCLAVMGGASVTTVSLGAALSELLRILVLLNLLLAFFNLLPIPPLDGSRIADGLMPRALRPAWDEFSSVGPWALGAVIVLPLLLGVSLFRVPLETADALIAWVLAA